MPNAQTVGTEFLTANFPNGFMGAKLVSAGNYGSVSVSAINYAGGAGTVGTSATAKLVTVNGQVIAPLYFLSVTGSYWEPLAVSAQAKREGMLIMLLMDGSDSMGTTLDSGGVNSACDDAATDAQAFLAYKQFDPDIDRIGMVAFGGQTYTVAPNGNFQASGSTNTVYSALTDYHLANNANGTSDSTAGASANQGCGGNTNTMEGLQQALVAIQNFYIQEKTNGYAACNTCRNRADIIVLMTDGAPNGMTNDWGPYIKGADNCNSNPTTSPIHLIGYVAKHGSQENGILSTALNTPTNDLAAMGTPNVTPSTNCEMTGNVVNPGPSNNRMYYFFQDFTGIPTTNYYGDAITGGSLIYPAATTGFSGDSPLNQSTDWDEFYFLYCNAAEAVASRLRSDANFKVTIFTIGIFGDSGTSTYDTPNCFLMYRLANVTQPGTMPATCAALNPPGADPAAYTANPNQPQGDFIIASTVNVLNTAFATVAQEISARLSK